MDLFGWGPSGISPNPLLDQGDVYVADLMMGGGLAERIASPGASPGPMCRIRVLRRDFLAKAAAGLVSLFLALAAISLADRTQAGQATIASQYTAIPPTIDGALSLGEWQNRGTITLDYYPGRSMAPGVDTLQANLYVMNDAINLYLAFAFQPVESPSQDRSLYVTFDADHDHAATSGREDAMRIVVSSGYADLYWDGSPLTGGNWWQRDLPTQNGQGRATYQAGSNSFVFEFQKPLNSGDAQDMARAPGETLGLRLELVDYQNGDVVMYRYPMGTVDVATDRWGEFADLTIARAQPTATPTPTAAAPTPTATPTPTPSGTATPTPGPPTYRVYLPLASK